jgi:hypothetical protein
VKTTVVTIFLIFLSSAGLACAGQGLKRFEPPTPTPAPEPELLHRIWAEQVCAFVPKLEEVATAWDQALDATPSPDLETMREELLHLVSFDFKETTSSASQYLGLLHGATASSSYWFGNPAFMAPPGVEAYEQTLFELFRDFEPVLNYAEADIRQARTLAGLEAIHASVGVAHERMVASAMEAALSVGPEALVALQSTAQCAYVLGPVN